jgi:ADP-dependent NAD(P)H-hydrate dehydratase / NAD(P)H-hydrate epimerase
MSMTVTGSVTQRLYTGDQTRALDALAQTQLGLTDTLLMKRAGRAAFQLAQQLWPMVKSWRLLCGGGNNGGDGYVFAALASQAGHAVAVNYLSDPQHLTGAAKAAFLYALQENVTVEPFTQVNWTPDTVVVDALLGTGLKTDVRPEWAAVMQLINQQHSPVLALDLPSGLNANTGAEMGVAIKAQHTLTFIAPKIGLYTGRGPSLAGQIHIADLGIPATLADSLDAAALRIQLYDGLAWLTPREQDAHKGQFGHVLVIGGDLGMGGAALLSAEAAAFSGAGMVSLATRSEHVGAALTRRPEIMALGVQRGQELQAKLSQASCVVVGPGLGRSAWSEQLLQVAVAAPHPLVLDADALNLLAAGRLPWPSHSQWVMTPHPGEAARLLGISAPEVQADRVAAVKALYTQYGGVVVLKGAGSLIYDGQQLWLAKVGNPALATAGSGDVLSGLIGSLMGQGLTPTQAACLGVCVHGAAADLCAPTTGLAGLQAAELLPALREILKA